MELARLLNGPGEVYGRGPECIDETTLAALVEGSAPDVRHTDISSHLADCDWCIRRIGLLSSLHEDTREELPPPAALERAEALIRESGRTRQAAYWVAAAVVLALVSGGTGWRLSEMRRETPRVRESERVLDERMAVDVLAPVRTTMLLEASRRVRWAPVADSLSYTVTLTGADGRLLWSEESGETEVRVPDELALKTSESYFLQIRANLSDGRSLRSGHIELRIAGH